MRRTVLGVGAVVLATAGAGCGPSDRQVGALVLMVAPLALVAGLGLNSWLHALWRRSKPELTIKGGVHWAAIAVLVVLAVVGGVAGKGADQWLSAGIWMFGTSYLALYLVVWRIELAVAPGSAFTWAPIHTLLVIVPAFPLLFGANADAVKPFIYLWIYPGYFGVVPLVLSIIFLIEAKVSSAGS